jgi:hypothetical protein
MRAKQQQLSQPTDNRIQLAVSNSYAYTITEQVQPVSCQLNQQQNRLEPAPISSYAHTITEQEWLVPQSAGPETEQGLAGTDQHLYITITEQVRQECSQLVQGRSDCAGTDQRLFSTIAEQEELVPQSAGPAKMKQINPGTGHHLIHSP